MSFWRKWGTDSVDNTIAERSDTENGERLRGVDWLRSLAIIGVTLFHVFPALVPGGFLGVNLFFIISGFLAAYGAAKLLNDEKPFSLTAYYGRRLRRIYPSLIIVLLVTVGACQLIAPRLLRGIGPELLSIVGGYNNLWQIEQNADYFTRLVGADPFTHMWFLGIELQFCLIFPIIFFLYRGISSGCGRKEGALLLALVGILMAGYIPKQFGLNPAQDVTPLYYGTVGRFYDLLLGAALGFYRGTGSLFQRSPENRQRRRGTSLPAKAVYGLLIVLTAAAFVMVNGSQPLLYRGGMVAMSAAFCLLLWLTVRENSPLGGAFENGVTGFIGHYSYGIFLWQYPVIVLTRQLGVTERLGEMAAGCLEIAAMVLLAVLTDKAEQGLAGLFVREFSEKNSIIPRLSAALAVLMMAWGCYGLALAPWEKAADTDDLRAKMAQNAEMLRQQKQSAPTAKPEEKKEAKPEAKQPEKPAAAPKEVKPEEKKPQTAVAIPHGIVCIGDSVMLGSAYAVKRVLPDCYIDADVCRYVGGGIPVAQELLAAGQMSDTVVIALGTNGPICGAERYEEQTVALLDMLGPDRRIFWVNTFGVDIDWIKMNNDYIANMHKRWPNVRVVDWYSRVNGHPEWLAGDEVHPNDDGVEQYAKLLKETIERDLRK